MHTCVIFLEIEVDEVVASRRVVFFKVSLFTLWVKIPLIVTILSVRNVKKQTITKYSYKLHLATAKFGVYVYLPDMQGTGAADVYIVQGSGNKADSVK